MIKHKIIAIYIPFLALALTSKTTYATNCESYQEVVAGVRTTVHNLKINPLKVRRIVFEMERFVKDPAFEFARVVLAPYINPGNVELFKLHDVVGENSKTNFVIGLDASHIYLLFRNNNGEWIRFDGAADRLFAVRKGMDIVNGGLVIEFPEVPQDKIARLGENLERLKFEKFATCYAALCRITKESGIEMPHNSNSPYTGDNLVSLLHRGIVVDGNNFSGTIYNLGSINLQDAVFNATKYSRMLKGMREGELSSKLMMGYMSGKAFLKWIFRISTSKKPPK